MVQDFDEQELLLQRGMEFRLLEVDESGGAPLDVVNE